ncbi:MAG: cytidylate kinase-like family protein [Butyrivibrio sp.]|nr:cytidylate kinase-like family protein [Butyrivibrio sp.]
MNNTVITIARSYGSGGRTLGKLLAEELHINCYDRELLRMASDESGINEALFGAADEKKKNQSLFSIAQNIYKGEVFPPDSDVFTSDDNLFNYQAKVIKGLAASESCVIIGRCADFVLKDFDNITRLFLYAPKENCIQRILNQEGGDEKEISKKIDKIDKYRAEYYRYYTGRNWYDARNYDFCIDTSSRSYNNLIGLVKSYIERNE